MPLVTRQRTCSHKVWGVGGVGGGVVGGSCVCVFFFVGVFYCLTPRVRSVVFISTICT